MNFTPEFYETDDAASEKWGAESPNGSFTGIIGEIVCDVIKKIRLLQTRSSAFR